MSRTLVTRAGQTCGSWRRPKDLRDCGWDSTKLCYTPRRRAGWPKCIPFQGVTHVHLRAYWPHRCLQVRKMCRGSAGNFSLKDLAPQPFSQDMNTNNAPTVRPESYPALESEAYRSLENIHDRVTVMPGFDTPWREPRAPSVGEEEE